MLKKLLTIFLTAFMAGMISLQSVVVMTLAIEGETPISSPISTPISSPVTEEPITSPIADPTPTPTPSPTPSATPSPTPEPVVSDNITSLISDGAFSIPSDATASATPQVTTTTQVTINAGSNSVVLSQGTVITRTDGADFNANQLVAQSVSTGSLSGLAQGSVVAGSVQWGLPNAGLTFSTPISLTINVGSTYNGKTLNILRSVNGSSNWTNDGIVAPATCSVTNGNCSFQATKASYYVSSQTSSSSSNSDSNSDSSSSTNTACVDAKPKNAPRLVSAVSREPNQVTLAWSRSEGPTTYYLVAYGLESGKMLYGNPNIGNTDTFTVKGLSGNTTYYFKVRAGNHCMPGDFSNEIAVKVSGSKITYAGSSKPLPATEFKEGVLSTSSSALNKENGDKFKLNLPFKPLTEVRSNRIWEYITSTLNLLVKGVSGLFNK